VQKEQLSMTQIEDALRRVTDVPTLPSTVLQVLQLLEFTDCSVSDLGKVISQDPPMAAKILKIANSSFYGFRETIGTINQAITILGIATLKNALLSMSIVDLFGTSTTSLDLPGIWTHSIATAAGAKLLAQRIRFPNAEKAFTAGLLHDLGKIIIAKYLPDGALEVRSIAMSQKIKFESAELHILGATHADVGAWLLHRWKLPSPIVDAVRLHHQPLLSKDNYELTAIIYLANILCHHAKLGNSGDRDDLAIDSRVFSYFKLKDADWIDLRDNIASKRAEIIEFTQSAAKAA
jgi:putative nucleotidyltransferase with HDIG domain